MRDAAKLYAVIETEFTMNRMPKNAELAWMAACDNAGVSHRIDSALYKAAAIDSLQDTSRFEFDGVAAYFETLGYVA